MHATLTSAINGRGSVHVREVEGEGGGGDREGEIERDNTDMALISPLPERA